MNVLNSYECREVIFVMKLRAFLRACGCLATVVARWIVCSDSSGHQRPPCRRAGEGRLAARPRMRAGPQREQSPGEELNFRLVCGETSQENELWHFMTVADKVPVSFLVNPLVSGGL